jgi:hypothetical protein
MELMKRLRQAAEQSVELAHAAMRAAAGMAAQAAQVAAAAGKGLQGSSPFI